MRPSVVLFLLPALCCAALSSCSSCVQGNSGKADKGEAVHYSKHFTTPSAPSMMGGEDALNYVAGHYWDELLSRDGKVSGDTSYIYGIPARELESAMADYVNLLKNIDLDKACDYIASFASSLSHKADTAASHYLSRQLERYVFDPNSPLRDEDLYAPYARFMSSCVSVGAEKQAAYSSDASLCMLNRRGTPATDFTFSYKDGRRGHLYGVKAPYTLVFFSNPGCHACKQIIDVLSAEGPVADMVSGGTLAVINIYIDEDLGEWYKYMPIYPSSWHNVYDPDYVIRGDETYNIRAIPSLYLLDKDKVVLLKDAPENVLYSALEQIIQTL